MMNNKKECLIKELDEIEAAINEPGRKTEKFVNQSKGRVLKIRDELDKLTTRSDPFSTEDQHLFIKCRKLYNLLIELAKSGFLNQDNKEKYTNSTTSDDSINKRKNTSQPEVRQNIPKYPKLSTESDRSSEKKNQANSTSQEPLKIVNVHELFSDDFDLNSIDHLDYIERIKKLDDYAKTFKDKVSNFEGAKNSLPYFVLDEKLMILIEKLDKIHCQNEPEAAAEKLRTIEYIKNLHSELDSRAKEE